MWNIVFVVRMLQKDNSLYRKPGGKEYFERTWMLIPKIMGSLWVSIIFYSLLAATVYTCMKNGGIERTIKINMGVIDQQIEDFG
jgi:hypothetical protein